MTPLDLEFRVFEEGGQEVLVFMQDGQGVGSLLTQVFQVASGEVGLTSVLAVTPTILDGIQFRTVGRQVLEAEPGRMFDREILGRLKMGPKIVPDEYNPISKMMMQVAQKRNQQRRVDIRAVHLEGEIHPAAYGRNRKRADHRESIAPCRFDQDRCTAQRRPGATDGRLEHEARFVQEYYMLAPASRPFFIRGHSTARQCSRASRSCCRARRSGFCGVNCS